MSLATNLIRTDGSWTRTHAQYYLYERKEIHGMTDPVSTPRSDGLDPSLLLWEEFVPGGGHWSGVMKRGTTLRLTDTKGGANVSALFFNQEEKLERYNMADTLKAQHTAYLTRGFVCYSDMGRVLCSITADTCGWHDTICGVMDAKQLLKKYGTHRFQEHRNSMYRSGRDGMLIELGKYGLGRRDLVANVNLFSKVIVDEKSPIPLPRKIALAGWR